MKGFLAAAVLGAATLAPAAFAAEASLDPTGTWLVEDGRAKIKMEKCGTDHKNLCGTVVWLKEPLDDKGQPKKDLQNPDPAKRSRPALGMELIKDLTPDDDLYVGQIYNAENGKMYTVKVHSEKQAELNVKGCLLSILCMSQHWTRVADLPLPATVASIGAKSKGHPAPIATPAPAPVAPQTEN
ncbi:DUF2147 domain-containing protein [Lichenihabitans sp. Uapishka_5]|uniref:DUF2147 domain-containing protein n=1 Tax=Lichenihabitans sp. Uapishka_5 TaxID=3037302 RepID=UPI0029E80327|nr:DUF2147 domain-containing protein [Lichenihabitans sp. Uapishka_5]MDX7950946.1 DUF2147 domain-containing protein [Lichenihabitans sp. Uapishka_5]